MKNVHVVVAFAMVAATMVSLPRAQQAQGPDMNAYYQLGPDSQ